MYRLKFIRVNWYFGDCRPHHQVQVENSDDRNRVDLWNACLFRWPDAAITWEDFIESTFYFIWNIAYYTHVLQGVYCKFFWVNKLPCYISVCFKHLPCVLHLVHFMFVGLSEAQHGLLLLQCCGNLLPDELPMTRTDVAHKIWDTLQELGTWHLAFQC